MWVIVYNYFLLPLLDVILNFASLFNSKIKEGISGRKDLFVQLHKKIKLLDSSKKIIWFHSSSMGEFEQAKPIIEKIKKEFDISVVVTFFSPSGYKNSLKYPYADLISYLPFDYPGPTKKFISLIKPSIVVLMRYDIWPNMIWQLKRENVPVLIVDATMRDNSKRTMLLSRSFHKSIFRDVTKILTVSENDAINFKKFDVPEDRIQAVGDTRFDRVYQKSIVAKDKKIFNKDIFVDKKTIVIGSSWEADEEVLIPALIKILRFDENIRIIIVPHEPTIQHIELLEQQLFKQISNIRFSLLNNYNNEKLIIVDTIGILLTLYNYADIAYVGGSFKQGIHNVLEPAVYGVPVIFGPKIENSQEAQKLVELESGIVIKNRKDAYKILRKLTADADELKRLGVISRDYVLENVGATEKIILEIQNHLK